MNVTIEQAYAEACQALGESVIRERLLSKALAEATAPQPQQPESAAD
jgi:hypothetical protein